MSSGINHVLLSDTVFQIFFFSDQCFSDEFLSQSVLANIGILESVTV